MRSDVDVVVLVGLVVDVVVVGDNWPTTIVTLLPFFAVALPAGRLREHDSVLALLVTVSVLIVTWKPAEVSALRRAVRCRLR